MVTVLTPDGEPAVGVKVGLADQSESDRAVGRTGPKGHWQQCGLTAGRSVRVVVWGRRGGMVNSQTVVVTAPRTFVTFRAPKRMDDDEEGRPDRRPPYRRRP